MDDARDGDIGGRRGLRYASGYGLLWTDFVSRAFPGDGIGNHEEELRRRFASLRPDTTVVPPAEIEAMRRSKGGARPLNANILRRRDIRGQGSPADVLPGTELYRVARGPDGPSAVVFIPDMTYRHDWILDDVPASRACDADVGVVRISEAAGFVPFASDYADRNGGSVSASDAAHMPPGRVFPAVPLSIRWYLVRMGVLDHPGVDSMRPTSAWYVVPR